MVAKKAVVKKPKGRPTVLSEAKMMKIFDYVCDGMPLKQVAKKIKVSRYTLYRWMDKHPEFKELMDKAREIQAQGYIDDLIEIADDTTGDILIGPDGTTKPNAANVARAKLKLVTRQKIAGYYAPKLFGYNQQHKLEVKTDGEAVFMGLMITPPKPEDDEEVIDVNQE